MMNNALQIGSWVATPKPGIWQVHRVEKFISLDPFSEQEAEQVICFVKRFLNDSLKRSFDGACFGCDQLTAFDAEAVKELEEFANDNHELYSKFEAYTPKPIDHIFNAVIKAPSHNSVEDIKRHISTDQEFTVSDIRQLIKSLKLEANGLPTWTLQFVSRGFTIRENYLIYKLTEIHEF